ncbi:MAG: hypothetical protein AAEJ52_10545 [Myxococcota bacterium]
MIGYGTGLAYPGSAPVPAAWHTASAGEYAALRTKRWKSRSFYDDCRTRTEHRIPVAVLEGSE